LADTRNAFGHGKTKVEPTPSWNVDEHLLFGAVTFPLLLKRVLSKTGYYRMTRVDEREVDALEPRMLCDLRTRVDDDAESQPPHPWVEVMTRILLGQLHQRLSTDSQSTQASD